MGKKKAPLSNLEVQKLSKTQGFHAVGGVSGLYLRVEGDSKTWVFRHSVGGRRRDMGLGPISETTLEHARLRAMEYRVQLRQGIDPMAERRAALQAMAVSSAKGLTFSQCMESYLEAHEDAWKNAKHRQQWRATLETYAAPFIGNLPVSGIDTGLVLKCLEPIWKTKTETASRLRGRIESILDWATVRNLRTGDNPARWRGHLDKLLAAPSKIATKGHHAALPYAEMAAFMPILRQQEGIGARALEFTILTAVRSGETRGATWAEMDLENAVWAIPAERIKAKKEHRVPLSPPALAILRSLPRLAETEIVFPGAKNQALSDMTLTSVLRRMGRSDLTAHGFRSTFRDWAAETTAYPSEVVEMALAHTIGNKTEAAYRRGDLFEKRRRLMDEWARHATTLQAKAGVTAIRAKRRASK